MNHLFNTHATDKPQSSPAKMIELQTCIQLLHNKHSHMLTQHRNSYFFEDLEFYLTMSMIAQMEFYIKHYQPVIMASAHQAEKNVQQ